MPLQFSRTPACSALTELSVKKPCPCLQTQQPPTKEACGCHTGAAARSLRRPLRWAKPTSSGALHQACRHRQRTWPGLGSRVSAILPSGGPGLQAGSHAACAHTPEPARHKLHVRPACKARASAGATAHSAFLWERRGGFGPAPCACSILARVYSAKPDTLTA